MTTWLPSCSSECVAVETVAAVAETDLLGLHASAPQAEGFEPPLFHHISGTRFQSHHLGLEFQPKFI